MALDTELSVIVAYVAVPLGLVFALLACMQCFKRKPAFSNFNSNTSSTRQGHVNTTFTLEISEADDDLANSTAVTIEPLPDIVAKAKMRPSILRPRITALEKPRQDSALKLVAHHQFPRGQIVYLKELGAGWFGKVIESDAEKIVSGVPRSRVVVKMLKDDANREEQQMFLEEVAPFRELEHANILHLLGQCTDINPMLLILEAAAYGNLKQYLRSHRQHKAALIQKNRLLQFGIHAASGLACLHRHDYLHKDLAARNCLVMGDFTVKIGDYGIAEDLYQEDYFNSGNDLLPIRWMAPETLKQENRTWVAHNFSKESDIWSLGVLLWEIAMMGERPYDMLTDEAVLQGVVLENEIKLPEPDIGMAQKDRMYEVMQFCWLQPSQRTKVDEVHSLLQQVAAKSGTAPEGDISEFEKKWEHLMPNQRHSSVDSIDAVDMGRQASVSSTDSDILNELSGPDSLEDFIGAEPEPARPVAPPRGMKKKVSAPAVTVPGTEETPEPVASPQQAPASAKIKPAQASKPAPEPQPKTKAAPATAEKVTPETRSNLENGPDAVPLAPKSPSASETSFTDFTSHDTVEDTISSTPDVSAVSAPGEDVFAASEKQPTEKMPAVAVSKAASAASPDVSLVTSTPEKPTAKEQKTSTPISKDNESSAFATAVESSASSTFLTANSSSSSQSADNYATASNTTIISDQNKTSDTIAEFSTFEEIPSMPTDNTESFVILETTAVPPGPQDTSRGQELLTSQEETAARELDINPTHTSASAPSPAVNETPAVNEEDIFGDFTQSETSKPVEPVPADTVKPMTNTDMQASGDFVTFKTPESSGQGDFQSLMDDSFVRIPEGQNMETPSSTEGAPEAEHVQGEDQLLSFGTDLSSLSSLTVPQPPAAEKEFPSFATDLSSLSSLDVPGTATPQAQQQDDPFGFSQQFVSAETAETPKLGDGGHADGSQEPSLGDFTGFDSLSSRSVSVAVRETQPDSAASKIKSSAAEDQAQETSRDTGSGGLGDLFGDFSTSDTQPTVNTSTNGGMSDPFGFGTPECSGNQSGTQQSLGDLFGSGDSAPTAPAPSSNPFVSADIMGSDTVSQQDVSPSQPPSASLDDFDLLSGFSFPPQPSAAEGSSDLLGGDGSPLEEFVGQAEAAANKVGTDVESKSENGSGASGEPEWSSPSTDTDSTTSDSGREYICEEPEPATSSGSPNIDPEEYALQLASEIYLSKGLKMARPYEAPALEPIPEDPGVGDESVPTPAPSETSSVDVRFEDVFEWDDFMGEPLVGKERTSESPKQSFEIPDWTLDVDSESLRSSSSVHSLRSEEPRGSNSSETQSAGSAETPSARSSISDSEVTLHGRNRTHRSYISDILSNRTKGLTFNSISASARTSSAVASKPKQFYSLFEEDYELELDSQSEGSCSPPIHTEESLGVHLPVGGFSTAVHVTQPSTYTSDLDPAVNGAHTNTQDSQDEVLVMGSGSATGGNKTSEGALLDFSAFESADSGVTSVASDEADKSTSSSAPGTHGTSLLDF